MKVSPNYRAPGANRSDKTHVAGIIRVARTGSYNATPSSANSYLMRYPCGSLTSIRQIVRYSTRLVRHTADDTSQAIIATAGAAVGTDGLHLPITVDLAQGGTASRPTPCYQDTLAVTVTQLAAPSYGATLDRQSLQ